MPLYTLGHSTLDLADFTALLQTHEIALLVDIRAFPASRRHPHFNRERLELWLPEAGIEYRWEQALGGRRKQMPGQSPHSALRNDSFRNYADYMLTEPFAQATARIRDWAQVRRTAIMCAERLWFQCHRMLVSDYFVAHGEEVLHIESTKPPRPHALTAAARMVEGRLLYRGDRLF